MRVWTEKLKRDLRRQWNNIRLDRGLEKLTQAEFEAAFTIIREGKSE